MTRGFVTLATGDSKYYKMAVSMLRSFKLHNSESRFAILCDRENEYTKEFDDVVILKNPCKDYRDKFRLLVDSPYDESIFIEPDCLVYRNLSFFWECLSKKSDFSSFGWNDADIDVWFKTEQAKERFKKAFPEIDRFPIFNPGYFFIRKGSGCRKMYTDCLKIADFILKDEVLKKELSLLVKGKLRDDPVFCVAMQINGFVCNVKPKEGKCISLPSGYKLDFIDIRNGRLDVTDKKGNVYKNCSLIHFSTRRANEEGLYIWQKTIVDMLYGKKSRLWVYLAETKAMFMLFSVYRYFQTRISKILKK